MTPSSLAGKTACVSCRCWLDAPGCDDAERHDPDYPTCCRGCGAGLADDAAYQRHRAAGGRPYEAWLVTPHGRRRLRMG